MEIAQMETTSKQMCMYQFSIILYLLIRISWNHEKHIKMCAADFRIGFGGDGSVGGELPTREKEYAPKWTN